MKREDMERIRTYADSVVQRGGSIMHLSSQERKDMELLIEQWCAENEIELNQKLIAVNTRICI